MDVDDHEQLSYPPRASLTKQPVGGKWEMAWKGRVISVAPPGIFKMTSSQGSKILFYCWKLKKGAARVTQLRGEVTYLLINKVAQACKLESENQGVLVFCAGSSWPWGSYSLAVNFASCHSLCSLVTVSGWALFRSCKFNKGTMKRWEYKLKTCN